MAPAGLRPLLSVPEVSVLAPLVFSPDDRWLGHRVEGTKISLFEVVHAPECRRLTAEPMSSEQIWETDVSPDGWWLAGAVRRRRPAVGPRLGRADSLAAEPRLPHRKVLPRRHVAGRQRVVGDVATADRSRRSRSGGGIADRPRRAAGPARGNPVGLVSLSRDGRTLATALPDAAVVFDLRSGAEKARFAGQRGLGGALLSPDARWLACCSWNGSGLKVFDLSTGKAVFGPPDSDKTAARFSPTVAGC